MIRRPLLALLAAAAMLSACGKAPATAPAAPAKAAAAPAAQGIFNRPVVIDAWVTDALARYDHNRDGDIDFRPTGWFAHDERERREVVRHDQRDEKGRLVRIRYTIYTYTLRDLFYAADRDADQAATRDEITAVVAKHDGDRDGELTRRGLWGLVTFKPKGEYDKFRDAFGERVSDVDHRDVDVNDRTEQLAIEREAPVVDAPTIDEEALR
jgi:hypothetical protein